MTHYHFITSNVEIESEYLEKYKVDWHKKIEGSKYKVQYILDYDPSTYEFEKVYEALLNHVANNNQYDYIVLEIAFALDAEGIPLQVNQRYKLDIGEFSVKHLIDLDLDEMIVIERNMWVERQFE